MLAHGWARVDNSKALAMAAEWYPDKEEADKGGLGIWRTS